ARWRRSRRSGSSCSKFAACHRCDAPPPLVMGKRSVNAFNAATEVGRMAVMAKPVLVVVDDDDTSLQELTRELEWRYGSHYQVVSVSLAEVALSRLAELKAAGADVPLVLADQRLAGMGGTQLLASVREFFPTARRGLLIFWGDMSPAAPFLK